MSSGRIYRRAWPGLELALECQWCGATDAVERDNPLACMAAASERGWQLMVGDRLQARCGPCSGKPAQVDLEDLVR